MRPNGTDLLKEDPSAPGGYRAPKAGEVLKNRLLAKTFTLLAEQGKAGFYEGPVAAAIVEISKQLGGYLSLHDLQTHKSELVEPVSIELDLGASAGPLNLWEHPPNGQGVVAQMALGIMDEFERQGTTPKFKEQDHNCPT